ncbi:MAG TPA: hypothetical protein VIG73_12375 [Cerasibacillus sp.]|uniref:hypothetical protein n=1 Tax=Cerasibacillus sp. TaxID=2498711 RepID=UPI002F40CA77
MWRQKLKKQIRLFLITVFMLVLIGSSMHVVFADENIRSLLFDWFERKEIESVEALEITITSEREKQINRLKDELQKTITEAEERINSFTENEKQIRISELEQHANDILETFTIDETAKEEEVKGQLMEIVNQAISEMDAIKIDLNQLIQIED